MKTEKEKEIDNLFKQGLENPANQSGYMDGDWDAMEQMLDERKKRTVIVYWLPILGSVAALLLLVIGWWLLKPVVTPKPQEQQFTINQSKVKQENKALGQQQAVKSIDIVTPKIEVQGSTAIANNTNRGNAKKYVNTGKAVAGVNTVKQGRANNRGPNNTLYTVGNITTGPKNIVKGTPQTSINAANSSSDLQLLAYNPALNIDNSQSADETIKPANIALRPSRAAIAANQAKIRSAYESRPQFAISVLASSDKNGVNSFQQTKPGNNAGLLLSMGVFKKFTISTGAIYTAKQYMTDFANYHTAYKFPTNPTTVLADCKMIDIPLNIDYQVFGNFHNKISIGTGLSSYIMLNENYQFNYEYSGTAGPSRYNVPSPDKYLLSIVNLQATYQRQVSSKVGITIQPYMKLPLSAVGASEVRLQTTGVALGLTWNLNSSSKP